MSVLVLTALLNAAPLTWDGRVWNALPLETRLAWAGGAVSGLAIASYLEEEPTLAIHGTTPKEIVDLLDLFYRSKSAAKIPLADALMLVGGRTKLEPEYGPRRRVPIPAYR